jgi:hypothetical protein
VGYSSGKDLATYLKANPKTMDTLPLERFGFKGACTASSSSSVPPQVQEWQPQVPCSPRTWISQHRLAADLASTPDPR